ncbi:MAG: lytic transglycosylase domain-containing protein [Gammaproteobacteria bacterium]|nr:lytic transglycosylase domain-containing protein [Gammaproteobacteria bacterium]
MRWRINRYAAILLLPLLYLPVGMPAQASTDPELRKLVKEAIESDVGFVDRFDAQVWLLDMSRRLEKFVPNTGTRIQMLKQVHYESKRVDIEPELVLAVIEVESRFDEYAISVSGARGLMQVMPFWLNEIGISDQNLFKIRTNLRMGCTILRYYIDMEPDSLMRALARYNGSLGRTVYPNKVISALQKNWFKQ